MNKKERDSGQDRPGAGQHPRHRAVCGHAVLRSLSSRPITFQSGLRTSRSPMVTRIFPSRTSTSPMRRTRLSQSSSSDSIPASR